MENFIFCSVKVKKTEGLKSNKKNVEMYEWTINLPYLIN